MSKTTERAKPNLMGPIWILMLFCLFVFLSLNVSGQVIPSISGEDTVCSGISTVPYSTEEGMSGYNWNLSSGGAIVSGAGTSEIEIAWNNAGIHTLSVTYIGATAPGILEITVMQTTIPSVSIEASLNPVCSGSNVVVTASPVNGGTNPEFAWKINDIIVGTGSSPTYTYAPSNGDAVWVEMTSAETCSNPQMVLSNTISMIVSPTLPVSVSITASANPVCAGTVVSFVASAMNGGNNPFYSWMVNGSPAGTNNASFFYAPEHGDVIGCQVTSSLGCASGNPASSNSVTMSVTPVLPVGVSVSASENPVCSGTEVIFNAVATNAGTAPVYTWYADGIAMGYTGSQMVYTPENGESLSCAVTSSATCTLGEITYSDPVVMTVNAYEAVSLEIAASANPACQGSAVTFTTTPSNGGTDPVYSWMVNGFSSGSNSPLFTTTPDDGDIITCELTSSIMCPSGNPATSNAIVMNMEPLLPVGVSINPSHNPVCEGTSVTFTATAINGGTSPEYQWVVNGNQVGTGGNTYGYIPTDLDEVQCVLTSNASCATGSPATSNLVTMSVTAAVASSITITASSNPSCEGGAVVFTAQPVNGGTNPQYQWLVDGNPEGINTPVWTYTPSNGEIITCSLTSSLSCVSQNPVGSNEIPMSVSPALPAGITIEASENPVCQGSNVTLTATPVNGGSSPVYQWLVNGITVGNNNPEYTYAPSDEDVVACILTSSLSCATGNPVTSDPLTLHVETQVPVSVSINASENPTCQGTLVTYTATPANGGLAPFFQWYANGIAVGTNSAIYSNTPTDGQVITCKLISNAFCILNQEAMSNALTMDVDPSFLVGVTIDASENPVCQGEAVTFTAIELNGGTSPDYQWLVNGLSVGTNSSTYAYFPTDGDIVTCTLTSNLNCALGNPATSNAIQLEVNNSLPVSITISPSSNPVCQGEPVTIAALVTNGGTSPSYAWQLNSLPIGSNNDSLTFTPVNGSVVTCEVTSNLQCASSNPATSSPVIMTVEPVTPVSVSIEAAENPVCEGSSVLFTATASNPGTTPVYQWTVNGLNVGTNQSSYAYTPLNNDLVQCSLASSATCPTVSPANSNTITMAVSNNLPASIGIEASANPFCTGDEVTITASANNGGPTPGFQWQLNGANTGSNQNTFTFYPNDGDKVNCILTSTATCVSGNPFFSDTLLLESTADLPVDIVIDASSNPACEGTYVIFTADPVNEGETPDFQWQVNGVNVGSNQQSYTYIPNDGDQVTCILTSSLSCASNNPATSNAISMDVTTGEPVTIAISANPTGIICAGTPVTYSAIMTNGGSTPTYQWSVNGSSVGSSSTTFQHTPVDGDIILCQGTSSESCALFNPALSNPITMSVNPFYSVGISIAASENPVCTGTWVTFEATPVNGGTNPMFQWQVNGNPVGINSSNHTYQPQDGDEITCTLTSNLNCTGNNPATSTPIVMQVEDNIPVSISIVSLLNPICEGSLIQFTATAINPGSGPTYQWYVNSNHVGNNHPIYQYFPANGDQVSCILTSSLACASGNPATSNTIDMVAFPASPVSVTIDGATEVCQNDSVTIIATPTNPGTDPIYYWKKNGTTTGTNDSVYSFVPVSGDEVYCLLLSDATCPTGNPATSNTLTFTIVPPEVVIASINASATTICEGEQVSFTASVTNGGSSPNYQWRVNGINSGQNNPSFVYTPSQGDEVVCEVTSSILCPVANPVQSNSIEITVSPMLQTSVTITSSGNPSCTGDPITYTAYPVHGGASPGFQWTVNGFIQGPGTNPWVYTPGNQDTVRCILTSSESCISNNPTISDSLIQSVSSNFPVTNIISASMNPVCLGQTVIYTSAASNTGENPVFEWTVNGIQVGSNDSILSMVPANNDSICCTVTSSYSCATNNPATSNTIVMDAGSALPASIQIASSANPVCEGTSVTYTATSQYGGTTPGYQWKVNGIPVGSNQTTYTYIPTHGDQITCMLTSSYACASNNPATSNTITMNVVSPQTCTASVAALTNPVCEGSPVTVAATVANGGTYPEYLWFVNGIPAGSNQSFHTYIPSNGDAVTCQVVSQNICTLGDTIQADTSTIDVSTSLSVDISITASENPVCQGEQVTFTAFPVNGGSNPGYTWKVNGIEVGCQEGSFTYIPTNQDSILCILTSNISCAINPVATSEPIHMSVMPNLPVSVTIEPSANPVCINETVTFIATPFHGGITPEYTWFVNGSAMAGSQSVFSYAPADDDTVTCLLNSSETCVTNNPALSNEIVMMVSSVPVQVGVLVDASTNPFCFGDSVVFTANPVNGGLAPQYSWFVNEHLSGTGNPITFWPEADDTITCVLLSNAACAQGNPATSASLIMTENPLVDASVSITANPPDAVCAGTSVLFSAHPVNGGINPDYQWFVNGQPVGTNAPQLPYIPTNNDTIVVEMVTKIDCPVTNPVYSNPWIANVLPNLPVSVSVMIDPPDPVCAGSEVTFEAHPVNGGSNPNYSWLVNNIVVSGTSSSLTTMVSTGDEIQCILSSNEVCTSNNPDTSDLIEANIFPETHIQYKNCISVTSRDAKPFVLRGGAPSSGFYLGDGVSNGIFDPASLPLTQDSATIWYRYTDMNGCVDSVSQVIRVEQTMVFVCGEALTDIRDMKTYQTIAIGDQCWFQENLNFGSMIPIENAQRDNCLFERYCYEDQVSNCLIGGGLYQWNEVMDYQDTEQVQGLCPPGWHLPTEAEWQQLFDAYAGLARAGNALKSGGTSGFEALLTGVGFQQCSWSFSGFSAFFWSSTLAGPIKSISHGMNIHNDGISTYNAPHNDAFSVRCIKD
jgi:uncharacterized protein (TIGR02145 family)